MADVNANIGVNIDTSDALAQLKNLQRQIASFHSSIAKSSEQAAVAQRNLQKNFLNSVNAIEGFSAELKTVRTTAESFTNSLEKNKFSMREYFRFAAAASGKFRKGFTSEFATIEKTAIERVKTLQTQYIKMGRDASGAMQAIAIRPTTLNMKDLGTQTAIAAQKQVIFNQLVKQGSTNLLNFGKNTQWAGRQLMVGFTLPLATLGMTAGRVFMSMEKAAIKFKKVYGDLFTAPEETKAAMEGIVELGKAYTAYGISVADSLDLAADAAAAGFAGADLQNQTSAALKLSVLGQLDLNKALETTISLQNAFGLSSEQLAGEIDFLNAVENQTVVALDDITEAIPRVAPVIKALGGDVRDLAFFMAALKEGGVNAAQGSNALKSGLASLINPTQRARDMLSSFNINIKGIIEANQGDLKGIVVDFAQALDTLDPVNRARAIEQLFGKFQFARMSTLFANVAQDGTQASRVLDLAGASIEELAALSEGELGVAAASSMNKFLAAVEQIKVALAPIGELFLQIATPIVEFGTRMLEAFNNLPGGIKKSITTVIAVIGGIAPIALMTFGLINNGIANMIKFFATVRLGYLRITGQAQGVGDETQYMTQEQLQAASAAASLDQAHSNLTQRFTAEKVAVDALRDAYKQAVDAGNRFALLNPGMMKPGTAMGNLPRLAKGGIIRGPGTGTSDSILSWLSNGEAVIPAKVVEENPELIEALVKGGFKIPGFAQGRTGLQMSIPGGAQLGHFSEAMNIAGKDLIELAKASVEAGKATQSELAKVIDAVGDNLDGMFKIFDNRVERISEELNRMVGDVGSGKTAPKELVERDLVERGRDARLPLVDRLKRAGVSPDQAIAKADKVTEEIKRRLDELGDGVQMTAEDINDLTQKAYEAVAETDREIEAAYEEMKKFETFKDESGARGARGQRESFGTGYIKQKGRVRTQAARLPGGSAYGVGAFKTTPEMAEIAGITEEQIQQMFKSLPENLKRSVYNELKNGTANFVEALVDAAETGAVQGIKESTQQASPSKKAHEAGKNIGVGAIDGIESQIDEAKVAGQQVGTAAVDGVGSTAGASAGGRKGPRRASTDGTVLWDMQGRQYRSQSEMARVLEGRQAGLARATQMSMERVSSFSTKLAGASFALTSVAGVASMFGGKIGEASGAIMQITSLFFALTTATAALMKAKTAEATMSMITSLNAGRTAEGLKDLAGGWRGGAKGLEGVKNGLKNLGKVFTTFAPRIAAGAKAIGAVFVGAAAALGVSVGVLLGAIAAIAAIIIGGVVAYKIAKDNVSKLGETANLSAEKLKTLGDIFDVIPRMADFSSRFTGTNAKTSEERNKVEMVLESEDFEKNFKTQIDAIKSASVDDAERVLNSLALQLSASGFESDAVSAIVDAIAIQAGRQDLDLSFATVSFSSAEGLASIQRIANETAGKLQTAFEGRNIWDNLGLGNFSKQLNTTAAEFTTVFQSLEIGLREGEISAEDFLTSIAALNTEVSSLDPKAAKDLVNVLAKNLQIEDKVEGLENFEDKLMLINATAAGIEIPEKVVKSLREASKAGADVKTLRDAKRLREEINDLLSEELLLKQEITEQEEQQAIVTAAVQDAQELLADQIQELENQRIAYEILTDAGWDAASAVEAVGDAAIAQALALAATADERAGIINDLATLARLRAESPVQQARSSGGGGGSAQKSPMQEAMESLGKQRTEIKNNISAYNGLRKAGFSAAEAASAAADATIAAALASKQVGSAEWKALVNQIRLARVEALKTAGGIRDAFAGLKNQADEYYDILERQVERKYADSIKAAEKQIKNLTRAIKGVNRVIEEYQDQISEIERDVELRFDRPIEALNEESSDLSNDLALIDRAADEITKRYDEQAEALERVNQINQRLINQQKQQIGLANALASGDISAAAGIMQDIRAANAEAAAASTKEMLEAAKQAEIGNLRSASGMSREDIEQRQFEITQEIYDLEEQREEKLLEIRGIQDTIYTIQRNQLRPLEKQLTQAEDLLENIQDRRDVELEAIDAQRQKWEDAQLALDLARIKAGEFNNVIDMAKKLTGDVVADWEKLADKTTRLTIETVMKEIGGQPFDAAITPESGSGGGGGGGSTPSTPEVEAEEDPAAQVPPGRTSPFGWLGDPEEQIQTWWQKVLAWFKELPGRIATAAGDIWAAIKGIPAWLGEQWENFKTWLKNLPYNVGFAVGFLWGKMQKIGDWLKIQWENFKTWLTVTLPNGVVQWGKDIWTKMQKIGEWLSTQWENFKTWLTVTLPNGIKNWAINLWTVGLPTLGKWLVDRANELKDWILGLPSRIANWAKNIWDGFWSGFSDGQARAAQTRNRGGMIHRNRGGMIPGYARGGDVPGLGNTDTVAAMLTPGEYVVNKRATAKFRPVLKAINAGTFGGGLEANRYKMGTPTYFPGEISGGVYQVPSRDYASRGTSESIYKNTRETPASQFENSVYNYSLNVNVNGTNADPNDIANAVMYKIKRMDSQRIRSQVIR